MKDENVNENSVRRAIPKSSWPQNENQSVGIRKMKMKYYWKEKQKYATNTHSM